MSDRFVAFTFANQWLVFFVVLLVLITSSEVGFRLGLRLFTRKDEPRKGQIGSVQGAVLALLGLLLGFTFSMAVNRFDYPRDLVLQEANSIGTTYLRASFLPEPHHVEVEALLRRYVDARIAFYDAGDDTAKRNEAEKTTAQLQQQLWTHAVVVAREAPTPITATFVTTLNDTIDLDSTRLNALRVKVPGAVWLLVLAVAATGCYASGYGTGATGARSAFANLLLPILITVVITLIADLDSPRRGFIGISQQPLRDLKTSIAKPGS